MLSYRLTLSYEESYRQGQVLYIPDGRGHRKQLRHRTGLTHPKDTFIGQALAGLQAKHDRWGGKRLPSFGRPESIIMNLEPDNGNRNSLSGTILDKLEWTVTIVAASKKTGRGTARPGLKK